MRLQNKNLQDSEKNINTSVDSSKLDSNQKPTDAISPEMLILNKDYYTENGFCVFTASYLKKRGYCCGSGCRHCPY